MTPEELRSAYKADTGEQIPDFDKFKWTIQDAKKECRLVKHSPDDPFFKGLFDYVEWLQRKASVTIAKEKAQAQKKAAEELFIKNRNK